MKSICRESFCDVIITILVYSDVFYQRETKAATVAYLLRSWYDPDSDLIACLCQITLQKF